MKTLSRLITALSALIFLHVTVVLGVDKVQPSASGCDLVLTWPSRTNETFLVYYRESLEPGSVWTALTTKYEADSTNTFTTFIHTNGLCGAGESMMSSAGTTGDESLSSAKEFETTSAQSAKTSPVRAYAEYKFPPLPWDEKTQAAISEDYPGLLPKRPWKESTQKWIVDIHELEVSRIQNTESGGISALSGISGPISRFYFVSSYTEDLDSDGIPNGYEILMNYNPLVADTNNDGVDDGLSDFDGDGVNNFDELLAGTDPTVSDTEVFTFLEDGLVLEGEQTIDFTPNPNLETLFEDVMLFANGNTANGIAVDLPTPGQLRIRWHSIFVTGFSAASAGQSANVANFQFTEEDRRLLREAFGDLGGTSTRNGIVIEANMDAVNRMRQELLEHLSEVSADQIPKMFKQIQELNLGIRDPGPNGLERALQIRLDNIHTQYVRGGAANRSLWLRFGVALNRVVPFVGGIIILANAENYAQRFDDAARDYANDISSGFEESGSAAIMAALCNELAPGSQNIVLNYLLR